MKTPLKNSIDYKHYGPEPKVWTPQILNWYNYFANKKDYIEWFNTYINKHKIDVELPILLPGYVGVSALFMNTNRELPQYIINKFNSYIEQLPPKKSQKKAEVNIKKPNIQDRIKEQVYTYCAELDGEIDNMLNNKCITKFDIKEFSNGIKAPQAKLIRLFYTKQLEDTKIKDEFTKEGYSYLTKAELKLYQLFLENIIKAMEIRESIKPKQKPRKKKTTPLYKQVQKLNYLDTSSEYNIMSINPEDIIGGNILIAFNTKTCTLYFYQADGRFEVKGTSLINMSKKSWKRKLRKPHEVLPKLSKSELIINRTIEELTTKPSECSSRITKDMVLLKVL